MNICPDEEWNGVVYSGANGGAFQTDRTSIVRHINNIYKIEELEREATYAKIAQVQINENNL